MNSMKILGVVVVLSLQSFHFVLAAPTEKTDENVLVVEKPKTIYQDSSEYNRMEKRYQVTFQPFGLNPTGAPGTSLSGGFFLDRNSLVLGEITTSSWRSDFLGSGYNIKSSSLGVHYKRFFSNSFYLRGGADYRKVDYQYNYTSRISGSTDFNNEMTFEGESFAGSLSIGNQWQWSNFTLGCDWIGLTAPISSNVKNQRLSGRIDSIDESRLEDDQDHLVRKGIATGLRFYLGASF